MALRYHHKYLLGPLFFFILTLGVYLAISSKNEYLQSYLHLHKHDDTPKPPTKMLVVASVAGENTSWVDDLDWEHSIYVPEPPIKNKGREANLYLTHIINNYDDLRDITAFTHHHRTAWHIDGPDKSIVELIAHLRLNFVEQEGFVNFRCGNIPGGCNDFIRPFEQSDNDDNSMMNYPSAYEYMFNASAPKFLAAPCCAQFAVTRSRIHGRSKEDYKRYHQWLMDTPLKDYDSGRIFEFLWHIIFGKDDVHCPNTKACWCNLYGWCDKGTFFP